MMKRVLPLLVAAVIGAAMLTGCSGSKFETGLGIATNYGEGHSKDATAEADGTAEIDSTIVALTVEKGIIKKLSLDVAQSSIKFNNAGAITSDISGEAASKLEKQDAYGMKARSAIGKEWYEQAAAFEKWAIGKSVNDVLALNVNAEGHAADADVAATVSIGVGDFLEAVQKASNNLKGGEAKKSAYKTGLGIVTNYGEGHSKDATAEADGTAEIDSTICALTLDGDKIVAISIDVAQSSIKFNAEGAITSDISGEAASKLEKQDAYGMKGRSAIGKEWYEQAAAFEKWAMGKTVSQVMALSVNAEGHATDADVAATVSIGVGDFLEAVQKAANNAK